MFQGIQKLQLNSCYRAVFKYVPGWSVLKKILGMEVQLEILTTTL